MYCSTYSIVWRLLICWLLGVSIYRWQETISIYGMCALTYLNDTGPAFSCGDDDV